MKNIIDLEKERLRWSLKNLPEATAQSSLEKLKGEIKEVEFELRNNPRNPEIIEEYADCLMCLFDSAGRAGILPKQIFEAFELKLKKNKKENGLKIQTILTLT